MRKRRRGEGIEREEKPRKDTKKADGVEERRREEKCSKDEEKKRKKSREVRKQNNKERKGEKKTLEVHQVFLSPFSSPVFLRHTYSLTSGRARHGRRRMSGASRPHCPKDLKWENPRDNPKDAKDASGEYPVRWWRPAREEEGPKWRERPQDLNMTLTNPSGPRLTPSGYPSHGS